MSGELPPVPIGLYLYGVDSKTLLFNLLSFPPPPTLQTVIDLGCQHDPSPFLLVSGHFLPISHSHYGRSSSTLPVHLYRGLPLFLISSFLVVTVYFGTFFPFTSCKGEGNIAIRNKNCARIPLGTINF